ncbi:hypothetical protein [Sporolactobacillus laevolacticus]|nr:hypothetical protein [Sporolactobacillus laevolacticus]
MRKEDPKLVQIYNGLGCFIGLLIDGIVFLYLQQQNKDSIYVNQADIRWVIIGTLFLMSLTAGTGIGWLLMGRRAYHSAYRHASQSFGLTAGACIGIVALIMGYGYIIFIVVLGACTIIGGTIGRLFAGSEEE